MNFPSLTVTKLGGTVEGVDVGEWVAVGETELQAKVKRRTIQTRNIFLFMGAG